MRRGVWVPAPRAQLRTRPGRHQGRGDIGSRPGRHRGRDDTDTAHDSNDHFLGASKGLAHTLSIG